MWVRRGMSAAVLTGSLVVASAGLAFSDPSSSDNNLGLGNGTILDLPIQSSVSACGNAVAFIGVSGASCPGGATAIQSGTGGTGSTSHNYGAGNGTQLSAPVQAPITVCGNAVAVRSEEHTSELQSRENLVCRLLLEKKKKTKNTQHVHVYRKQD